MSDAPKAGIEVVCELDVPGRLITAKEADKLSRAIRAALRQVLPDHRVRAVWVSSKPKVGYL